MTSLNEQTPQPYRPTSVSNHFDVMQAMLDELRRQAEKQEQQVLRQAEHEERIKILESQVEPDPQLYAITGWANLRGIKVQDYGQFGQFATRQARSRGISLGAKRHAVYGVVNTYPLEFLDEIYQLWPKKEV